MRAFGVDTPNENDSCFSVGQPDAGIYQRPFLTGVALPHCREISIDAGVDNAVEIVWRQWFLFVKGHGHFFVTNGFAPRDFRPATREEIQR